MTGLNMKRWREVETLELQSKRYRKDASKMDPSAEEPPKKRTTDDALAYLKVVKETFKDDESKYREMLRILKDFQSKNIGTKTLVSLVKTLFKGHPDLLLGLNEFLPKDYRIDDPTVVEVAPTSNGDLLVPTNQPANVQEGNETSDDLEPVDLQRALDFVNKVKARFKRDEEHVYNGFLAILNHYRQGLAIGEVTRRVSALFVGHRDLVEDFSCFLPPGMRPTPVPSVALRPTTHENPARTDKADGTSQVQDMVPKDTGKRATSPTDIHRETEGLAQTVPEHSPPKAKKQRREADKDQEADVLPMHLSPMSKKQRINVDEEVTDATEHSGRQELTNVGRNQTYLCTSQALPLQCSSPKLEKQWKKSGTVGDDIDRADHGDSDEYLKVLREQNPLQKVRQKDSPLEVKMQQKTTDMAEEEKGTAEDNESKECGKEVGVNGIASEKLPEEHSFTKIRKQWKRTEKEEDDTTHWSGSKESAKVGAGWEQLGVHVSQKFPQEQAPPQIGMQQKIDNGMKEDDTTYNILEVEDNQHELREQMHVCTAQKMSEENSPTKIKKQRAKADKVEEENDITHQSGCEESSKEGGENTDVCASPKLPWEHPSPKIRKQQKNTDKAEEMNCTTHHSNSKNSAKEVSSKPRPAATPPYVPSPFVLDAIGNALSRAFGVEARPSHSAAQKLPQEETPTKFKKQRIKTDKMEEESDTTHQGEIKESAKEGGEQTDVCASQMLPQARPSPKMKKVQKKAEKIMEEKDARHYCDSAKEVGEKTDVYVAQTVPQYHSPTKIRKQWMGIDKEENNTTHQSGSEESAQEVKDPRIVCALQMLPQECSPLKVRKQQKMEEETNDTTHQSGSKDSLKEVGKQTHVRASNKLPSEHSPIMVRKHLKKADMTKEENVALERSPPKVRNQDEKADSNEEENDETDRSGSDESGQEAVNQLMQRVVDASQPVPQKRSSARLAHELIRKQCQAAAAAAAAGLAVQAACTARLAEEGQKRIKLQQLESKLVVQEMALHERQREFFEKVKKTVEQSCKSGLLSKCLQTFSKEILSCPELQALVSEVLEEQELEYSQCQRSTASYYLLPKSYLKPLTTHRRDFERSILNDNWVSTGYDSECKENSQDESSGARKQIGREGASKRVPHDKRLFHEEKLSLCEDDQFELDMLRETTASTIQRVAKMVEVTQALNFCMQSFDWHKYLTPVHFRCLERIYGDYGVEFIEKAQKNSVIALPIILDRLKQKEEDEWPKYQVEMDKSWADVHAEHYHKSLDYSRSYGKQSENMQLCADIFLNESDSSEDDMEDDNIADGEPEHLIPVLSFGHPDLDAMYHIIEYLLTQEDLTEEQFKRIQTIWSVHLDSADGSLSNTLGEWEKDLAREMIAT